MATGLFVGLTTVDIFNYVARYPKSNEKMRGRDQLIVGGGPAANAAVAYAAFGNTTRLVTGLGEQPLAALAAKDLHDHRVELVDLVENPETLPVLSSIIVDESTGNRSVVYSETGGRRLLSNADLEVLLQGCSVLMADGYYLDKAIELATLANSLGVPVVLDGGSWKMGLEELIPFVDYAICSANFFPPGCETSESVFSYLRGMGVANLAISGGGGPIYGWSKGSSSQISVEQVEVLDTLGAGDILHGAFCHYIGEHDFFQSLHLAAKVASYSCTVRGTRAWIKDSPQRFQDILVG